VYDPRFGVARLPGLGVGQPYYAWGTQARAINEAGQIVGHAQGAGGAEHPVRWDRDVLTDLGLLPGLVEGVAIDINEAGVIVGGLSNQIFEFGLRPTAAFVVTGGVMYELNTLFPPGTGFVAHQGEAINNAGQILVSMNPPPTNFPTRYGVLTPVP
jgi:probable HAF family extracellular repeat protein